MFPVSGNARLGRAAEGLALKGSGKGLPGGAPTFACESRRTFSESDRRRPERLRRLGGGFPEPAVSG